jgi:hypothetical protein
MTKTTAAHAPKFHTNLYVVVYLPKGGFEETEYCSTEVGRDALLDMLASDGARVVRSERIR